MDKYVIDFKIHGYDTLEIDDNRLKNKQCDIVVVLSENSVKPLKEYYKTISAVLKLNGNVTLIGVEDKSEKFKPLATLLTTYRNYNIYSVHNKEVINAPYIKKIELRKPDFNEVQTYIGGDVAAYSELSTLMIGIESLVEQGDISGLSAFMEQHMSSIESLSTSLDYMKTICELTNSNELLDKINDLEEMALKNKSEADKCKSKLEELQSDKAKIKAETESLTKMIETLKNKNEMLKESAESGGAVITTFTECNTSQIQCKAKNIIYFKEISYVPFMNTLVTVLLELYKSRELNAKVVIYDNKTELYQVYNPINIVNGKNYVSNKETLLKKNKLFVVSEPAPMIINDLLTLEPALDVLIVYDRMKCQKDVVIGNNVTKFFVINSKQEYDKLTPILNIVDESKIITRSDAEFASGALDIPVIERYKGLSDSAKVVKYVRLKTNISKGTIGLIDAIHAKARIELKN